MSAERSVKRETGENPVLSRNCIQEAIHDATGKLGRRILHSLLARRPAHNHVSIVTRDDRDYEAFDIYI